MGWYTAVVIVCAISENMDDPRIDPRIKAYNKNYWIDRINVINPDPDSDFQYVDPDYSIDGPFYPSDGEWGCGLQANMCQASIKNLDIVALVNHLKSLPWESPSQVQIFFLDEHDEKWSLYDFPFQSLLDRYNP